MKYSNSGIELFNKTGVNIENKNYTNAEVGKLKI